MQSSRLVPDLPHAAGFCLREFEKPKKATLNRSSCYSSRAILTRVACKVILEMSCASSTSFESSTCTERTSCADGGRGIERTSECSTAWIIGHDAAVSSICRYILPHTHKLKSLIRPSSINRCELTEFATHCHTQGPLDAQPRPDSNRSLGSTTHSAHQRTTGNPSLGCQYAAHRVRLDRTTLRTVPWPR